MYKKYIKIEEIDSKYRYEYDELDIGTLFRTSNDDELYIRTEDGALSLKTYKTVHFAKGSYVVHPCEVTEMKEAENFDNDFDQENYKTL